MQAPAHAALCIKDPHRYFVHAARDPVKSEPAPSKSTAQEPEEQAHSSMEPLKACTAIVELFDEMSAQGLNGQFSASKPMAPPKALAAAKDLFVAMQGGTGTGDDGREHPEAGVPLCFVELKTKSSYSKSLSWDAYGTGADY
jgi:hypothetical protein